MIKTVVSVDLPIDETLLIKKNVITGGTGKKKISIVTGIHGDELEGQLVCFEIQQRIKDNPQFLNGTVDIYPALNPLGMDSITRTIPAFDMDMNKTFPGFSDGTMVEYISSQIMEDLKSSDFVVDIHASSIFIRELPQVRIPLDFKDRLIEKCRCMNLDLIWAYNSSSVQENSLAYCLNDVGIDAVVIDMGIAMACTKNYCKQVTDGLFALMQHLGIWNGPVEKTKDSIYAENKESIEILSSSVSGMFVRETECGSDVKKGEVLGRIIDPLSGNIKCEIKAPEDGLLFTIREYPVVEIGSLIGRIFKCRK
ncbi:MAG: succinylglutamate desuccinylase/aspartoacylase family protein [Treponema sp.]|nr:succinylglutamate desuccinylase/aspartoacylase family protein [Treponema sp.]